MALPGMDLPVHAAGEWPGAVSGKFTDKFTALPLRRKIVDTPCRNGDPTGLGLNGFGRYFTDTDGLIPAESKRIIPVPGSQVYNWRPSKRCLSEPGSLHLEKPEGRARVDMAPTKVYSMPEKRHVRQVESKEEYGDLPQAKRVVVREHNNLRASDQPAREVDISAEMARKVRTLNLEEQRNGIPCRSQGDKIYRHPEYMPKFHHAGGLIVGCGFHRGMHKKTEPRNSTSIQLVIDGDRKPTKSYREKMMEQQAFEAQAEVEELTRNWETGTLKECDEKYAEPIDSDDEIPAEAAEE
eukprot:CAMPEP_0197652846 /NCGR_PEP_ID=MMETSP1338-20131121/34691_1 /TAXON_ID=43686 ORGANISM="Pelagodinium beii, Strain RCC1491" /NCGR_SAMPLE_ID=MMETSP1338 /ASSEMBLY_ACC=CAM_ASM_000754 /LENGTH=295 /DNA_ID=CAMNT_0043227795 /DNA_START=54 /DNA_END=941 /DNA_ORIENTATION=+